MKIAVASNDGIHISPHFGRSQHFVIFEVEDGAIAGKQIVDNTFTGHARGRCDGQKGHHHDQPHSHANILHVLRGCEIVLCGGMGPRAFYDLMMNGIKAFSVDTNLTAEDAVIKFLKEEISGGEPFCSCD